MGNLNIPVVRGGMIQHNADPKKKADFVHVECIVMQLNMRSPLKKKIKCKGES